MRRIFITALLFPAYLTVSIGEPSGKQIDPVAFAKRYYYERFVHSLTWVESRHNPRAVGRDGDRGLFQITPVRVHDYNQRTGSRYTEQDCFDPAISRRIFDYYSEGLPFEEAARRWNGGPTGMRKTATVYYWDRIIERMY